VTWNEIALAPTSLPNTPPLEFISAAASAGFDSIGLRLHKSPVYPNWFPIVGNAALMRDVKRAVADSGLRMLDIFTFYLQPETDLAVMAEAMAYGAELGARYAQLIGDDSDWGRMTDHFAGFCDIAAGFGLVAAIEAPVNSRKINSVPLARKLIADAGRPNAALVLDPLQFFRSGDDVSELEHDVHVFAYTQFNDGHVDGPRTEPGMGDVPLRRILDALPPGLPISVEWSTSAAFWTRATPRAPHNPSAGSDLPYCARLSNMAAMSVESNKIAARRFVEEVLDGGDGEVLLALFMPGAVRHFPPGDIRVEPTSSPAPTHGRSMKTDIHHLYGEGDYVTIHLTHHVTFGAGATFRTRVGLVDVGGRSVDWDAMAILRFEGDKIAEEWVVRDELHVLMQLGVIGPPAEET
jgi:sugar phosphate isomerase/epimerase